MTSLEYQERADYCREQAGIAISPELRARWLKVAEVWLIMAIDAERAFQVTVDAMAKARQIAH